jgi:AcrR family transcriptional regulator
LQAATDLVAERGVAGTSLDAVRERAHASKSQVYLYFADRDELTRAVSEATCDAVMQVQSDVLAGFDSLEGIERYLQAMAARGELRPGADRALLAKQTLAALQGGLLLTQVRRDPGQLRIAADGVLALIRAQLKP